MSPSFSELFQFHAVSRVLSPFYCYDWIIRDEIAGCSEKAYDYVSISDARQMLLFSSDQELLAYVKEVIEKNILFQVLESF